MNRMVAMTVAAAAGLILFSGTEANAAKGTPAKVNGVVNLNQASATQLDLLPGVGEKAARKIIAYREKTPFKRIEELVKVKGFGKKKFEKLKGHLAVSGQSTLVAEKTSGQPKARTGPPGR